MIESMIGRVVMLWVMLASVCLAEHATYSKAGGERKTGLWALLGADEWRMDVHYFRAEDTELCIVDEGDEAPRYGSLENAMKREQCQAGVNGGYFGADAKRTPIGLVRHAGKTISPLGSKGFTVVGVVYDTGATIRMERTARLRTPVQAMREGIQGGPFLVDQGRVVTGLEKQKKAARTFIATNGEGRWCIGVTSPLTLHELASWLAEPGSMGDFRVQSALNLDGGSSCAFWDKGAKVSQPSFKAVRNYVGVRPRGLSAAGRSSSTPPAK